MKYNIIYADPPWSYDDKLMGGNRGAFCKYQVLSINDICNFTINNIPIRNLSADNCVLFMWVTHPKLNECLEVIKAWGFEYKTVAFTWIKLNKLANFPIYPCNLFTGLGRWTRGNAEICLLATKGQPQKFSSSVHSVIITPIERHSKKPDEARRRIVELCGDLPKIELFARQVPKGWDCDGNVAVKLKSIKSTLNKRLNI